MSIARNQLIERLTVFDKCAQNLVVTNGLPNELERNSIAGLFRNGLAIMAFAIIEAFLKDRVREVLKRFDSNSVTFTDLSEKLQETVTLEALRGLSFRLKSQPKQTKISWTLAQLPQITNAAINISDLSDFSFGHANSNLMSNDVSEILKAFGVNDSWRSISNLAKRVGLGGIVDYEDAFKNLAKERHKAAHDITSNVPQIELIEARKKILGICVPFDLLLSHAHSLHNIKLAPHTTQLIDHRHLTLRFISNHPKGGFREQVENTNRNPITVSTFKVHATLALAQSSALNNGQLKRQQTVLIGSNGIPESWHSW